MILFWTRPAALPCCWCNCSRACSMAGLVLHDAAEDDFGTLLKPTLESDNRRWHFSFCGTDVWGRLGMKTGVLRCARAVPSARERRPDEDQGLGLELGEDRHVPQGQQDHSVRRHPLGRPRHGDRGERACAGQEGPGTSAQGGCVRCRLTPLPIRRGFQ